MEKKMQLELILWTITLVVILLVMFPIWSVMGMDFTFHHSNVLAIFIFLTFTRLIFLLRHSYMSRSVALKIFFILVSIPLFILFVTRLNEFQTFIDENGTLALLGTYRPHDDISLARYMRYEYIFFVTASLITIVMMPFRMIISIWRTHNRGTV